MNPSNHTRPLGDDDIARLEALLEAADPQESMVVEELDGFLAALACCPEPVPQEEWLPEVLGSSSVQAPEPLLKLLERHRTAVAGMLYEGAGYSPVLAYDDEGVALGNAWAIGFVRGMALRPDAWAGLDDDDEHADALDPVMRLVAEAEGVDGDDEEAGEVRYLNGGGNSADSAASGQGDAIAGDERDELLHAMFDGVQDVFDFFRDERERRLGPQAPIRRDADKLGRNDPCRCGSGRKFKNCCGAQQH